jgi:hypothetical protein
MIFTGMLQVWKISKGPYINAIGRNEVRIRTIKSRGPVIYYDNAYGFDSYELTVSLPKDSDCPFSPGMLLYVNGEIRTINSKYSDSGDKWIYILVCNHKDIKIIGQVDLPCDPVAHIRETKSNSRGL